MKKTICVILSICLIVSLFCSCGNNTETEEIIVEQTQNNSISNVTTDNTSSDISIESQTSESNAEDESSQNAPSTCQHVYETQIKTKAELFKMGEKTTACIKCGDSSTDEYCIDEIKILSISNSYGKNALWELYDMCKLAGFKKIDIAVMYIAGCSLDAHWENIQNNNAAYEVFRNNNGSWTSTKNCTIDSLLSEGDWDVITTQNSSGLSGKTDGYSNLNNVADYIKNKCPNSKLVWHLIWGYQNGSQWLTPSNYNGDEKLMFESIVNCTNNIVIPSKKFDS
ncbi:MAG: DUF4886 domain-containing protein, partial [Clostridia bacterium]|nr:DUF4886 domain-containing protein [Clostridia bacterium]